MIALPFELGGLTARLGRSVAAALGLVLLPKCPLCIAAYLVGFGLSSSVATCAAPFIRPAAWVFVAATSAGVAHGAWRRRVQRLRAAPRELTLESTNPTRCCCD
jgi:hypothetical protein